MKKFINHWLLLGVLSIAIMSCGGDDNEGGGGDDPFADFTAKTTVDSKSVTFTNTSDFGESYAWSFGDGTTSTEESPVHVYPDFGKYSVTLTVTGAEGTDPSIKKTDVIVPDLCPAPVAENLIKGGEFNAGCEPLWTVTKSNVKELSPKYTFGAVTGITGDAGKGLLVQNNPLSALDKGESVILSQSLGDLTVGTYRFSANMKATEGDLSADGNKKPAIDFQAHYMYFQFCISKKAPETDKGFKDVTDPGSLIASNEGWGAKNLPAVDGSFIETATNYGLADETGEFEITSAGKYYFVIAIGKNSYGGTDPEKPNWGSFGPNGIGLDQVTLTRIGDLPE